MKPVLPIFLSVIFSLTITITLAQKPKPVSAKPPIVQKFKPPKLYCSLGNHSDSTIISVEEATQIVKLPLKITDDKKNIYTISSYQLMYKRRGVTEDEQTGKVSPITSKVAQLFRETPVTTLWQNILSEQLKSGDELFFFDIIVKDTLGRLMFAPDLKIKIN